ncbi:hypothetical protein SISNIDRAFT_456871 [Sistotremastrum niveocremeum HHB9708]|uniref:Uncharacterized protein n=2 Tax=Sistotremastraceae TaxID=3402574 RepID=A0A164S989_9AGAM|nr:hypothetical protein SISNIDRAFT_456871 [Sistotremastrum niveocremeum HHB9708]KZT34494.1 hypothetical protein SISSUDRAFT_1052739 [Sistotremastrum suecicum HHB10207 ss-3]
MSDNILPGDVVAVNVQHLGRREGVVVGSHYDVSGRHIVEIQFDHGDYYHEWYPLVTRVKRTTYYRTLPGHRTRYVERDVYW